MFGSYGQGQERVVIQFCQAQAVVSKLLQTLRACRNFVHVGGDGCIYFQVSLSV